MRDSIRSHPNDGVLVKVSSNGFGRLQSQTQREVALLSRPFSAFFAAGAFNGLQPQLLKLAGKFGMPALVGVVGLDSPARVIGGQESAASDAAGSE